MGDIAHDTWYRVRAYDVNDGILPGLMRRFKKVKTWPSSQPGQSHGDRGKNALAYISSQKSRLSLVTTYDCLHLQFKYDTYTIKLVKLLKIL